MPYCLVCKLTTCPSAGIYDGYEDDCAMTDMTVREDDYDDDDEEEVEVVKG